VFEKYSPIAMTPVYDILLRGSSEIPIGLYHLHIAKAEQLCRLHYSPKSIKLIKARLRMLAIHHYVQEDWTPTRLYRSPYCYVLGSKGVEHLQEIGVDVNDSFRSSKEVGKHYLFIQHALELNDILIAAALLRQVAPNYYLDSFIHERALRRKPYKVTWQGERFSLIPDAFLDFRMMLPDGGYRRMPILLEHDRGSEQQRYFRRRIRAYLTLLKSEAYKDLLGVKSITIAFTTFVGAKRLAQMREWTRQELAVTNESKAIGLTFCFSSLTQPLDPYRLWLEPCWHTLLNEQPIPLLVEDNYAGQ